LPDLNVSSLKLPDLNVSSLKLPDLNTSAIDTGILTGAAKSLEEKTKDALKGTLEKSGTTLEDAKKAIENIDLGNLAG
jgi:hypothetical protein